MPFLFSVAKKCENLLTQILIDNAFCYQQTFPLAVPMYSFGVSLLILNPFSAPFIYGLKNCA